jgi:hypothetical protein
MKEKSTVYILSGICALFAHLAVISFLPPEKTTIASALAGRRRRQAVASDVGARDRARCGGIP